MKKLTVLLATLLVFYAGDAQQILSGIYSGSMYNDSTKMLQKYELALSEYRGKVMGYSYVTFVVNDTFYYGIRRVKGYKNDHNELVLTDEELLANNFPESPAKRVRRTAIFPLAQEDTITALKGTWQTNRTRQYYSVGGATKTERSVDSSQSALVAHLKELKIIAGQPNYQEATVARNKPKKEERKPKEPEVAKAKDSKDKAPAAVTPDRNTRPTAPATPQDAADPAVATRPYTANPVGTPDKTVAVAPTRKNAEQKKDANLAAATQADKTPARGHTEPAAHNTNPAATNATAATGVKAPATGAQAPRKVAPESSTAATSPAQSNPAAVNTATVVKTGTDKKTEAAKGADVSTTGTAKPSAETAKSTAATQMDKTAGSEVAATKAGAPTEKAAEPGTKSNREQRNDRKDAALAREAVAAVTSPELRASKVIKTLEVVNDSITLSFYDNGVVDGDVISVFVNGENVIAMARLNEVAMKKTIHLTNFAADSVEVTLVAETLGSIPPNTGLVLVYDGDQRYDVRFSADLQTNASIVFRKGKK